MAPPFALYHEGPLTFALLPYQHTEPELLSQPCTPLRSEREKRFNRNQTSKLLSLPVEIRDTTFEYALSEPRKWDKRHLPSCESYDKAGDAFELPPFRSYDQLANVTSRRRRKEQSSEDDGAHHICARRSGLSLLQACKQIYEEAAQIFFDSNTFCFDSPKTFVRTFHLLSDASKSKIRSISIMGFRDGMTYLHTEQEYWLSEMLGIMASMSGLQDVELPAECIRYDFNGNIARLRRLKSITLLKTESMTLTAIGGRFPVYMALSRRYPVPVCSDRSHWRSSTCQQCKDFFKGLRDESEGLMRALTKGGQYWETAAKDKLQTKNATHADSRVPHRTTVSLQAFGRTEVRVWGLPRRTKQEVAREQKQRELEEAASVRRALLVRQGVRPRQHPSIEYVTEEDEEVEHKSVGRTAGNHRCQQQRVAKAEEEKLEEERLRRHEQIIKNKTFTIGNWIYKPKMPPAPPPPTKEALQKQKQEDRGKMDKMLQRQEMEFQAKAKARSVRKALSQKKAARRKW